MIHKSFHVIAWLANMQMFQSAERVGLACLPDSTQPLWTSVHSCVIRP